MFWVPSNFLICPKHGTDWQGTMTHTRAWNKFFVWKKSIGGSGKRKKEGKKEKKGKKKKSHFWPHFSHCTVLYTTARQLFSTRAPSPHNPLYAYTIYSHVTFLVYPTGAFDWFLYANFSTRPHVNLTLGLILNFNVLCPDQSIFAYNTY